jgi:metal-dependent hydrolase (beta-lactamase superfamily II)
MPAALRPRRRLLLDFGHTSEALMNNMALMGVDPAGQDARVLSHGHRDHCGGLTGYLRRHRARLRHAGGRRARAGAFVADEHLHEHGIAYHVADMGLVVISACGHAGIVNTVRQAIEVSGVSKVHAVVGGFHLFTASDDYLGRTVAELKAFDPDVVIPLHCSGPEFVNMMRGTWGDRLVASTTGTEFQFGW